MSPFVHEEPQNPSKRCKCLASTLKDAFSNCHTFRRRLSASVPHEDDPASDFDVEEEEVKDSKPLPFFSNCRAPKVFVSAIVSKYMESKCRRQRSYTMDSFCWAFSPETVELFIAKKETMQQRDTDDEEKEKFFDVGSHLSCCCSSASSMEAYLSVQTSFSRCSSLNRLDFPYIRKHSIFQEFRHCEGWPFGLCRRALLLPPLPKSPSDSWSWRKSARIIKTH